jgi:hypothetical protein
MVPKEDEVMIDSSLPDDPWDELELGLESDLSPEAVASERSESWDGSESWIDEDTWIDDGTWEDGNLTESLTLKYLGPQAVRAA